MHKSYLTVFLFFISSLTIFAQRQPNPGGGGGQGMRNMPAIGRLYGKIVDAKTKQPVDFATVTLLAVQKDSVISGMLAKANGDFSLDKLPMGRYRLRVSFIGYQQLTQQVTITPSNIEQDLGNISLLVDAKSLKEAVIEGERAAVIMTVDRRIYNVDKDISARGGTGIDAVKNIPGLSVDADGGVTLRNSSPTIFVDGRPTLLTLEQIPSDQIDRIEVITNPSAKYDASTSGGILNIILKKNTKPGYNGLLTMGAGYPNRYNGMLSLNIKEGRSNFNISYNINTASNPTKGFTNRTLFRNGETTGFYNQNNDVVMDRLMQNGRIAYDYNVTNRTTLSISQGLITGGFDSDEKQFFNDRDSANNLLTYGSRVTTGVTNWDNYSTQLQLRKTFPKRGKELSTDITYNFGDRKNNSDFTTNNYNSIGQPITAQEIQVNRGSGTSKTLTYQLDFTNPITDTAKWEFGLRSNYKEEVSIIDVGYRNNSSGELLMDSTLSNNFIINDLVNAAYATYSNMYKPMAINYMVGLRFEQTRFFGELVGKNQSVEYLYPDGMSNLGKAFFPSIYLTKRFGEKHEIQMNFARKISRPGFMQVMPFIMFADKMNYRTGNPLLRPEFINSVEANYNRIFTNGNLFTSVYVRQTEGAITQFAQKYNDTSDVLLNTFINGNNMYNMGWENNFKISFLKRKLDLTVNLNGFHTDISANVGNTIIKNSGFSWNTKAIVNYKLPKQYTVQINGSYEAPRIIPQGKTLDQYSIDVSFNKEIMKTLSFNLIVNDIFNTRRFGTYYESDVIQQNISRRRETRFVRLSITWRFGEMDTSLFRKRSNQRRDGGGGAMEMEY
jgi:outer membrane cobalamin receptor